MNKSGAARLCLGLLLVSMPAAAVADDLMELLAIATTADSRYLSARHKYLANQEGIAQTRADLLPNITLQYEDKTTDQRINDSENVVFAAGSDEYDTTTSGVTLTQSIFDYTRWQRYSQSKFSADKAEVEFQLAYQEMLLRLAETYFLVLERNDQLQTVLAEKEAMSKHLLNAERRLASGLGRRIDVEDTEARYLNTLTREFELQSRLADSRYALREIVGLIPERLATLGPGMEMEGPSPNDPDAWLWLASQYNLELQAMNLSLQVAQREVRALRGEHFPTVDLIYTDYNTDTEGSVFGGGSDIDSEDIVLQVNIPVFSSGATSSRVRQATEKRFSIVEDINEKRRNVERTAQDAFNRVQTAVVQVGALERSLLAQERLLRSKEAGYRTGLNGILEVLDVQQELSQVSQALTKARYDYILNSLRLKFTAGNLEDADLAAINQWLVDDDS